MRYHHFCTDEYSIDTHIKHKYNEFSNEIIRSTFVTVSAKPSMLVYFTVPLKGNVALALHSTARTSRIKHSILALNAHSASERRVVNHSRLVRVFSIVSHSSLGLMPTASSGE